MSRNERSLEDYLTELRTRCRHLENLVEHNKRSSVTDFLARLKQELAAEQKAHDAYIYQLHSHYTEQLKQLRAYQQLYRTRPEVLEEQLDKYDDFKHYRYAVFYLSGVRHALENTQFADFSIVFDRLQKVTLRISKLENSLIQRTGKLVEFNMLAKSVCKLQRLYAEDLQSWKHLAAEAQSELTDVKNYLAKERSEREQEGRNFREQEAVLQHYIGQLTAENSRLREHLRDSDADLQRLAQRQMWIASHY